MKVTAISSLNLFARDGALQAIFDKLRAEPDDSVTAVTLESIDPPEDAEFGPDPDFPEAGENPDRIYLKLSTKTQFQETAETLCILGDCVSCATNAVLPDILESLETEHVALALPLGVSLEGIISLAAAQDVHELTIESAVFTSLTDSAETDLWTSRTLSDLGVTGSCLDERKPGEFLVKELALADTCIAVDMPFEHVSRAVKKRTRELIEHIAPHLVVASAQSLATHVAICGCHDVQAVSTRSESGYLNLPDQLEGENFTTVVLHTDRLLDAQKLGKSLGHIVKNACRARGYFWMSGYENEKVAFESAGPQAWLHSLGRWAGTAPCTAIAVTGQGLRQSELQEILDSCTMSRDRLVENLLKTAD